MDEWQLRERTVAVLEAAVAGEVEPAAAAQLLADLRAVWTREQRWRNNVPRPAPVRHVAGPVIDSREYRRSCPQFIVDRRQACSTCGIELVRGRWAMFFTEGQAVGVLGTIKYASRGQDVEVPCEEVARCASA